MSENEPINIFENSVALSITIGKIGIKRKVSTEKIDVKKGENGEDTDKDQLHLQKSILGCDEFDAINSLDNAIRISLSKLALPAPFRRGVYLIPLALLEKVDAMIRKYQTEREEAVEKFISVYDVRKDEAQAKLGPLYDASDYPVAQSVKASFYTRVNYLSLGVPGKLNDLNPDIFRREQAAFKATLEDAAEEVRMALREGFGSLVQGMVEKLQDSPEGERKIFRDSLVNNLKEFMDVFEARNIANDSDLQKLIEKAKQITSGCDAKTLREDDGLRKRVQKDMNTIKKDLDNLIVNAPRSRKLNLDE